MREGVARTPAQVVEALDRYVIGQHRAKRAVAIALRNRWRRSLLSEELRDEVSPKNIIMIGPTGVGKTEIARRLAHLAGAPFLKIEASKFTEIGYVGRDVESMVRDLVEVSINLVRAEMVARTKSRCLEAAEEKILEVLGQQHQGRAVRAREESGVHAAVSEAFVVGQDGVAHREPVAPGQGEGLRRRLRAGEFDQELVELELEESSASVFDTLGVSSPTLRAESQIELGEIFRGLFPEAKRPKTRRVTVAEGMKVLVQQELDRLLDKEQIQRQALQRVSQHGIIFLDEVDKIASTSGGARGGAPDVSREGVQRDLLPLIEGTSVMTKYGVVETDHILFIAAGAFQGTKPSDLIPEIQGRFPIRVELESLTQEDFVRILDEPRNALTKQYRALIATEGVEVTIEPGAVAEIAKVAWQANERLENIGARRLHTIMELVFDDLLFDAPSRIGDVVVVDAPYVQERLSDLLEDLDLSRYIL